ncbi:MAG TPA: hypothetical protein VN687_09460 [Blastocatellia bacterium]|nr:hypothetical protein [Blastocatellia bacterium]
MTKDVQRRVPSPAIARRLGTLDPRAEFKQSLVRRFVVRFHMALMLMALGASGLLISKVLLEAGVRSMLERYLIAVVLSYALFFLFIKLWLMYVSPAKPKPKSRSVDVGNVFDIGELPVDLAGKTSAAGDQIFGGSGDFGGGGATDLWGGDTAQAIISTPSTRGGGGGSHMFDFDLDEGIVLIVLALLLLSIFGAGAYLVYAAPEILSEAAFEALLAAGLIKASKKIDESGWMGSVLKATWIPFVIVLVMTGIFGFVAQTYYPHAARLADIFKKPASDGRQLPSSR